MTNSCTNICMASPESFAARISRFVSLCIGAGQTHLPDSRNPLHYFPLSQRDAPRSTWGLIPCPGMYSFTISWSYKGSTGIPSRSHEAHPTVCGKSKCTGRAEAVGMAIDRGERDR